MEIAGAITGLLHRTKVCQTFVNDHDVPLEAVYTHPLPPKASVHGFRLVIGNRVVEGTVQERGQARKAYAQAVSQGHRAALMEEERSDIFTTTVGNIAPGEQVSITFELSGPLEFLESTASLRFPLVVPEVYISGNALGGGDVGDGTSPDTDSVPDASRITPPRLAEGSANPVNFKLSFNVDPAGLQLEEVDSLCHFAKTRQKDDGTFEISLLPGMERLDRDFVVRLRLKEDTLQTTLVNDAETGTFALTVVPPLGQERRPAPRDLVIVLDRSGSMRGWSMTAARRAAARIVESLTPQDRFAIIAFDDRLELLDPHLVPAEFRHQERAQEFLSKVESRGGTEARPAIERALQMLKVETSADKTVLFITDGDVGNDSELVVRSAGGVRVSTVGIGRNSRAGVLESMAKTSGGLCSLIPEESTLEESLRNLHQRLGRPHWMGVSLSGVNVEGQAPRFWDVWEGVPTTFFGKASGLGDEVTVEGWLASTGRHSQKVAVRRRDDLVIHRSWARARLLDLDDLWTIGKAEQHELVALSVEAQVLCRFTAFAAIDTSEVVANSEQLKTVVQPVEPTLKSVAQQPVFAKRMQSRSMQAASLAPCAPPLPAGAPVRRKEEVACDAPPAPCLQMADAEGGYVEMLSECESQAPDRARRQAPASLRDEAPMLNQAPPARARSSERPSPGLTAGAIGGRVLGKKLKAEVSPTVSAKQKLANSIWERLLKLLEGLANAGPSQKAAILEQMVEILGEHCRKAPAGADAVIGKEVMSLLIDLQQSVEEGKDDQTQVVALRAVLESLG
jgi:Ca-activated chloride channel family protein